MCGIHDALTARGFVFVVVGLFDIGLVIDENTGELLAPPVISSIGFVFEEEKAEIHREILMKVVSTLPKREIESAVNKNAYREQIRGLCFSKTRKRPLILFNVTKI